MELVCVTVEIVDSGNDNLVLIYCFSEIWLKQYGIVYCVAVDSKEM